MFYEAGVLHESQYFAPTQLPQQGKTERTVANRKIWFFILCSMFFSGDALSRAPTRPLYRLRENYTTKVKDGRSELQVLHNVELGDSREHVNRLLDFGKAPEGGFPRWSLRYIKTVFLPALSDNSFIKSHGSFRLLSPESNIKVALQTHLFFFRISGQTRDNFSPLPKMSYFPCVFASQRYFTGSGSSCPPCKKLYKGKRPGSTKSKFYGSTFTSWAEGFQDVDVRFASETRHLDGLQYSFEDHRRLRGWSSGVRSTRGAPCTSLFRLLIGDFQFHR